MKTLTGWAQTSLGRHSATVLLIFTLLIGIYTLFKLLSKGWALSPGALFQVAAYGTLEALPMLVTTIAYLMVRDMKEQRVSELLQAYGFKRRKWFGVFLAPALSIVLISASYQFWWKPSLKVTQDHLPRSSGAIQAGKGVLWTEPEFRWMSQKKNQLISLQAESNGRDHRSHLLGAGMLSSLGEDSHQLQFRSGLFPFRAIQKIELREMNLIGLVDQGAWYTIILRLNQPLVLPFFILLGALLAHWSPWQALWRGIVPVCLYVVLFSEWRRHPHWPPPLALVPLLTFITTLILFTRRRRSR